VYRLTTAWNNLEHVGDMDADSVGAVISTAIGTIEAMPGGRRRDTTLVVELIER